jgi:hypothetical protein
MVLPFFCTRWLISEGVNQKKERIPWDRCKKSEKGRELKL